MALNFLSQSVPDQWQVEDRTQYSGSILDIVMSGTIFDTVMTQFSLGGRFRIAEHGSGSNLFTRISGTSFQLDESLYFAHLKHRMCGVNYSFISPVCSTETYYDSLIPDPYAIYSLNSGVLVYSRLEDSRSYGTNDTYYAMNNNAKFILSYGDIPVLATDTKPSTNISDNYWLKDYPFMGKYSNIKRLATFPAIQQPYTASEFFTFSASTVLDVAYSSTIGTGVPGGGFISNPNEINIELVSLSQSGDVNFSNSTPYFRRTFYSVIGTISGTNFTFVSNSLTGAYGLTRFATSYANQISNPFAKVFYGIGNGFRGSAEFDNATNDHSGSSFYYRAVSPKIRGWKYGLYNGTPIQTKAIFDRRKFGQLRYMYEQRPYTRNCNIQSNQIGSLDGPILIQFVSGTAAAVSASNSTLYNPNDSGIYNIFYMSGRPWADV